MLSAEDSNCGIPLALATTWIELTNSKSLHPGLSPLIELNIFLLYKIEPIHTSIIQTYLSTYLKYQAMAASFYQFSSMTQWLLIGFLMAAAVSAGNFYNDFDITWGQSKSRILDNGNVLVLNLDKESGSGFQSRNEYLFGKIDMQLKLVAGNSAGTVTAYYVHVSSLFLPFSTYLYAGFTNVKLFLYVLSFAVVF